MMCKTRMPRTSCSKASKSRSDSRRSDSQRPWPCRPTSPPPESGGASRCPGVVQGVGFLPFVYRRATALLISAGTRWAASRTVKIPTRRRSAPATSTAPMHPSRMQRRASCTVASDGKVSGSGRRAYPAAFLMVADLAWSVDPAMRCCFKVDRFDFDEAGVKLPIADPLQPGEPLLRCFDRPFRAACQSNQDRALAASEKPIVARNFIEEANAIARHPAFLPTVSRGCLDDPARTDDHLDQLHRPARQPLL